MYRFVILTFFDFSDFFFFLEFMAFFSCLEHVCVHKCTHRICMKILYSFQYNIVYFCRITNQLLYRHLARTLFFINIKAISILRLRIVLKMSIFQAYTQAEKIL